MNYLSLILYALLGMELGMAGIGVSDKPLEFFVIALTVVAIDFVGSTYYKE